LPLLPFDAHQIEGGTITKFKFLLFIAVLVGFAAPAHAGHDDGKTAYDSGDYANAYEQFQKLGGLGDAEAQYFWGRMYDRGLGVSKDHAEAVNWCRKAADQGDALAQTTLGWAYASGNGVPQDYVQAHMWFNLAAAQGYPEAQMDIDAVAEKMTLAQIAEAQRFANEWKPKGQH